MPLIDFDPPPELFQLEPPEGSPMATLILPDSMFWYVLLPAPVFFLVPVYWADMNEDSAG